MHLLWDCDDGSQIRRSFQPWRAPLPDADEWNLWPSAYIKGSERGQSGLERLDAAKDQLRRLLVKQAHRP